MDGYAIHRTSFLPLTTTSHCWLLLDSEPVTGPETGSFAAFRLAIAQVVCSLTGSFSSPSGIIRTSTSYLCWKTSANELMALWSTCVSLTADCMRESAGVCHKGIASPTCSSNSTNTQLSELGWAFGWDGNEMSGGRKSSLDPGGTWLPRSPALSLIAMGGMDIK